MSLSANWTLKSFDVESWAFSALGAASVARATDSAGTSGDSCWGGEVGATSRPLNYMNTMVHSEVYAAPDSLASSSLFFGFAPAFFFCNCLNYLSARTAVSRYCLSGCLKLLFSTCVCHVELSRRCRRYCVDVRTFLP